VGAALLLPVIAVGVVLAATGPTTDLLAPDDGSARAARPVLLAGAAALSFGASLYATSRASVDLPVPWVLLPARLIGVAAIAVPLALRGTLTLTRPAVPLVVAAGVCEVLGFASFAAGARHGVAVAAVLASQFAALAAVGAFVLFRERLTRLQLSGVSLLALGVATLAAIRA
jgi:drug/metabolite transporter (DMT)-like permease